jgi:hypothetical protein
MMSIGDVFMVKVVAWKNTGGGRIPSVYPENPCTAPDLVAENHLQTI